MKAPGGQSSGQEGRDHQDSVQVGRDQEKKASLTFVHSSVAVVSHGSVIKIKQAFFYWEKTNKQTNKNFLYYLVIFSMRGKWLLIYS